MHSRFSNAECQVVLPQGFEPRSLESKSRVLPLDEGRMEVAEGGGVEPLHVEAYPGFRSRSPANPAPPSKIGAPCRSRTHALDVRSVGPDSVGQRANWRILQDSNLRAAYAAGALAKRCLKPLGQRSMLERPEGIEPYPAQLGRLAHALHVGRINWWTASVSRRPWCPCKGLLRPCAQPVLVLRRGLEPRS